MEISAATTATTTDSANSPQERHQMRHDNYKRELVYLLKNLRNEALVSIEDFSHDSQDPLGFYIPFCKLYEVLENLDSPLLDILELAPRYDFQEVQANGYRSLVKVTHKCLLHILVLVRYVSVNRNSYLFRTAHYSKELGSYVQALGQLREVLKYALKLVDFCPEETLCPPESLLDTDMVDEIQVGLDNIDQESFYGRTLGFQYCESLKKPFELVHIGLASYSHNYKMVIPRYIKLAGSVLTSSKYLLNPELRAEKVVDVTLNSDIDFCKAFWGLSETDLMHKMASFAMPVASVNHVFCIDASTDICLDNLSGAAVTIPAPSAHVGIRPIYMRLISGQYRVGQERLPEFPQQMSLAAPQSEYLIIQCHGGGFVSQTSRTHEAYLRLWANELEVPIICIDYSLAPEAPYPRALEEVYYAYLWILQNCHKLGSTAKSICVVGDSAGGNLLLATMLRLITEELRLPDGIVACYTPVHIQFIPSPSRILSVMDALIPVGILTKCLEAYAGDQIETEKEREQRKSISISGEHADSEEMFVTDNQLVHSSCETCNVERTSDNVKVAKFGIELHSDTQDEDAEVESLLCEEPKMEDISLSDVAQHQSMLAHKRHHTRNSSMPVFSTRAHQIEPSHSTMRHYAQSPLRKFQKIRIKQNPSISPLLAEDVVLSKMPPTYLIACHLDPCLDDSVSFAIKLDNLGVKVHLDAVEDVPHGFMNFGLVSRECKQAIDLIASRLKLALGMPQD